MNLLKNLEFLNSSEEINKLKSLNDKEKIKEYFLEKGIKISPEKAEEIKNLIFNAKILNDNEKYNNIPNDSDSSVLEASGGKSIANNVIALGVAVILGAGTLKFGWDVKNEYKSRSNMVGNIFGVLKDTVKDNGFFGSSIYDTAVRKTANGIINLQNYLISGN